MTCGQWPAEAWLVRLRNTRSPSPHRSLAASGGGPQRRAIASRRASGDDPRRRSDRQLVKMLESLAVVRADGALSLAELLTVRGGASGGTTSCRHHPTRSTNAGSRGARRDCAAWSTGFGVLIEPGTFGSAPRLCSRSARWRRRIPAHLVKYGEPIASAFASPAHTQMRGVRATCPPIPAPHPARAGHWHGLARGMTPAEGWRA